MSHTGVLQLVLPVTRALLAPDAQRIRALRSVFCILLFSEVISPLLCRAPIQQVAHKPVRSAVQVLLRSDFCLYRAFFPSIKQTTLISFAGQSGTASPNPAATSSSACVACSPGLFLLSVVGSFDVVSHFPFNRNVLGCWRCDLFELPCWLRVRYCLLCCHV